MRNWILARFHAECVVMLDDDITACVCMIAPKVQRLPLAETMAMIANMAY